MTSKLQVFVSSTFQDLTKDRQAAVEAILKAGQYLGRNRDILAFLTRDSKELLVTIQNVRILCLAVPKSEILLISRRMYFNWMRSITEQVVIALTCLLLPACSGFMTNKYAAELASPLGANTGAGLIILSTGSLESCHPSLNHSTVVDIYPSDDSFFRSEVASVQVDSSFLDSEYEGHHGHLYILKLSAGKYYLVPRKVTMGGYSSPPRADFEVYANETTYLGEFYMDNKCGRGAKFILRDQEARDLTMLRSRNPSFRMIGITKRLLAFSGCDRFSIFCPR